MNSIDTIICKNSTDHIIADIRDKLHEGINGSDIKDIYLVDVAEKEVVILVSTEEISEKEAKAFWLGYQRALE